MYFLGAMSGCSGSLVRWWSEGLRRIAERYVPANYVVIKEAATEKAVEKKVIDADFRSLIQSSDSSKGQIAHKSHIFLDHYRLPPYADISESARLSREIENAGGTSDVSEMYSIDYLVRRYEAHSLIFETEVEYWISYKMVDFICTIDHQRVGVSVARAMAYPNPEKFTAESASRLLYKKLYGLIVARNSVLDHQSFYRSILHIWCQTPTIAHLMHQAFCSLDSDDYGLDVKGVVILQLTVCPDPQLYKNRIL